MNRATIPMGPTRCCRRRFVTRGVDPPSDQIREVFSYNVTGKRLKLGLSVSPNQHPSICSATRCGIAPPPHSRTNGLAEGFVSKLADGANWPRLPSRANLERLLVQDDDEDTACPYLSSGSHVADRRPQSRERGRCLCGGRIGSSWSRSTTDFAIGRLLTQVSDDPNSSPSLSQSSSCQCSTRLPGGTIRQRFRSRRTISSLISSPASTGVATGRVYEPERASNACASARVPPSASACRYARRSSLVKYVKPLTASRPPPRRRARRDRRGRRRADRSPSSPARSAPPTTPRPQGPRSPCTASQYVRASRTVDRDPHRQRSHHRAPVSPTHSTGHKTDTIYSASPH